MQSIVNETFGRDERYIESLFVNRYQKGGFYKRHHDGIARIATVLIYLSTHTDGGGTIFANATPAFTVRPQEGMALVFWNVHPDRQVDLSAVHEAQPADGVKWVANLWIHEHPIHRWPLGWLHPLTAVLVYFGFMSTVDPPRFQESAERACIVGAVLVTMGVIWQLLFCWLGPDDDDGDRPEGAIAVRRPLAPPQQQHPRPKTENLLP